MKSSLKRILFTLTIAATVSIMAHAQINQILDSIKLKMAPDTRTAIWEISTEKENNMYIFNGKVDNPLVKKEIQNAMAKKGIKYKDNIVVLPNTDKQWGLIMLSVASLRTAGKHAAEMATQAIMGTPVKVLEKKNDWYRIQTPDNYIAYVPSTSLKLLEKNEFENWKKSKRYIVTAYQTSLFESPGNKDAIVSDLVMGNILEYIGSEANIVKLRTPDGREGYANAGDVKELSSWADQSFNPALIEKTARRMMGSPYLWGGTSTKANDCSGFSKTCYFANGIILQRDASQQALTGKKIDASDWKSAETGDLLFFGSKNGRVTHVAIYLANGEYIHSSGRVKINSVDPEAKGYLTTPFLSISRINGKIGTQGITKVKDNKWYF